METFSPALSVAADTTFSRRDLLVFKRSPGRPELCSRNGSQKQERKNPATPSRTCFPGASQAGESGKFQEPPGSFQKVLRPS